MSKFTLTNMVMIVDERNGKVLVQNRVKKYPGVAFPGGHVEKGESIYDSSVREIKEETGYDIKNLVSKGFIYWDNKNGNKYFTYFFRTTNYSGDLLEETEEGRVFWIHLSELSTMKLAENMQLYIKMFIGDFTECYVKELERGGFEISYK